MPPSLLKLLDEDRRYKLEAYLFIRDALAYAHEVMRLGSGEPTGEDESGDRDPDSSLPDIGLLSSFPNSPPYHPPEYEDEFSSMLGDDDDDSDDDLDDLEDEFDEELDDDLDSALEDELTEALRKQLAEQVGFVDETRGERASPISRHVTGQQLCEAIRRFALEQFGLMAKLVLNSFGLYSTGDFGEVVYNLISLDLLKKSDSDRREDFDDVFDFDEAFCDEFEFSAPK